MTERATPIALMDFDGDEPYGLFDPEYGLKVALPHPGARRRRCRRDRRRSTRRPPPSSSAGPGGRTRAWSTRAPASRPASTPAPRTSGFVIRRHGPVVVVSACNGQGFQFAPETGERAARRRRRRRRRRAPREHGRAHADRREPLGSRSRALRRGRERAEPGRALRHAALRRLRGPAAPQRARASSAPSRERWPGEFMLLPSIKANASLALRAILNEEGTGCDVFGPGELEIALSTGADPSGISLNGPMKDEALLERAIRAGVRITLDSVAELERTREVATRIGVQAMIRLRFRPDLVGRDEPSEMSPAGLSVRGALDRYKAGIPTEDILALAEAEVRDPAVDLRGIHLHVGRHSADPGVWEAAVASLGALLADLRSRWGGWTPRELDVGGGYPAPRDPFGRLDPKRAEAPDHAPPIDRVCRDDLRVAGPRARADRGRTGERPARGRAGARALRGRRRPPGDGRQRQAPARADRADLGRDGLLRRLPPGRQPRAQSMDLPAGRQRRRAGNRDRRRHRSHLRAGRDRSGRGPAAGARRATCSRFSTPAPTRRPAPRTSTRYRGRAPCSCAARRPS